MEGMPLDLLSKFSNTNRNTKFKDILPWNISNNRKDGPIQHEKSSEMKKDIPC